MTTAALLLMYVVLPVWMAAGFLDWVCHRRSRIERTSGLKESAIHILMFAEIGVPLLAAVFFQIDAAIIGVMVAAAIAHDVTAYWDLRVAAPRRTVTPFEQHIHGYLGWLPFAAILLVVASHWQVFLQFLNLDFGPDFPAWKNPPLPPAYVVSLLASLFLLVVLPYGEEILRCAVARKNSPSSRAEPSRSGRT